MRKHLAYRNNMTKNALYFTWYNCNKKCLEVQMTTDDDKLLETVNSECMRLCIRWSTVHLMMVEEFVRWIGTVLSSQQCGSRTWLLPPAISQLPAVIDRYPQQ